MPSNNPRINVVCDPALHEAIAEIAQREGVSLSAVAQDLMLESLELREDVALARVAERRLKNFDRSKAVTDEEVFG